MPTTNESKPDTALLHLKVVRADGSVTTDQDLGVYYVGLVQKSKTWVRTPGYFAGMKKRSLVGFDLPMNDFTSFYYKLSSPPSELSLVSVESVSPEGVPSYSTTTYSGALTGSGYLGSLYPSFAPVTLPPIDLQYLDEKAKSRFLSEVKDQRVNLLQVVGERRQTIRLIESSIMRIVSAVSRLKARDYAGAARALGKVASSGRVKRFNRRVKHDYVSALADAWLELQYGWLPLIQDAKGAAEFIAQRALNEHRVRTVKSATSTRIDSKALPSQSGSPWIRKTVYRRVTVKYVAYYESSDAVHAATQLGLLNVPAVAYELTPFSFVLDWFLPLGTYLSNLDSTSGLTWKKGCKTVFERIVVQAQTLPSRTRYSGQSIGTVVAVSGTASMGEEIVNVTRTKMNSWPDIELPSFKNPASVVHVLNALALLKKTVRLK